MSDVWRLTWMDGESDEKDCPGIYFSFVHLHGVLMYVAWGLLLPLGALLGRYYRFCWPVWFILHIIVQVSESRVRWREGGGQGEQGEERDRVKGEREKGKQRGVRRRERRGE